MEGEGGFVRMSIEGASYGSAGSGAAGFQPGYRITPLNRLAFPKGKIPKCELSGHLATVACVTPNITLYYATEEQAEQAWHGTVPFTSGLVFCVVARVVYDGHVFESCTDSV